MRNKCAETLAECPSWWNCPQRGCREDAIARYGDSKRDMERGYPAPRAYEYEYSPMGERITYPKGKP